jgi:hypothetical protein
VFLLLQVLTKQGEEALVIIYNQIINHAASVSIDDCLYASSAPIISDHSGSCQLKLTTKAEAVKV